MLLLGLSASELWGKTPANSALRHEARFFEFALPVTAALFVFGSLRRQLKNYLATGLLFVAIGVVRLEQDFFKQRAIWPLCLLLAGMALMLAAANYSPLRMAVSRVIRRRP
jgi:peptidoglycan/LPS O-acetylase OafA/YrhL